MTAHGYSYWGSGSPQRSSEVARVKESEWISMRRQYRYLRVLSIAGSDSGGGAGIQADLKTMAALGCYGMSALTAVTAQNTCGVSAVHPVPIDVLTAQIDAVCADIGVDALKIGMLHSSALIAEVASAIDRHALSPVVLDPVMVSTSGSRLIEDRAVETLCATLMPKVDLITPNLDEAAVLTGMSLRSEADLYRAAQRLIERGARAVLVKGGHLPGREVCDLYLSSDGQSRLWVDSRIASQNLHGTGCTLSAAIACYLAQGLSMTQAIEHARSYVRGALAAGRDVRTGSGNGPLNHSYLPLAMRLIEVDTRSVD